MDIDEEKPRVSNDGSEGCNDGELDLNEEIRVSGDDLGGMKDGVDEIRVSDDGVSNGDDLDLNEEVRVLNDGDLDETKDEIEEIRVSSGEGGEGGNVVGYYENGDSAVVDGETVVKDENSEFRNGENEVKKLESSSIIVTENLQDVEMGENDTDVDKPEDYGSSRSGNSVLRIPDDFGGDGESDSKPMEGIEGDFKLESRKDFGGEGESDTKPMDGIDSDFKLEKQKDFGGEGESDNKSMKSQDGDFKLERRKDIGAPLSRRYLGIDIEGSVMKSLSAKVSGTEFEMGDMVWGKVKSHPWWPGHLYNDAFASSSVRRSKRDGHILIAFFGDSSYGWFYPDDLIPYDPNYADKYQQTTSRNFVRAVEESIDEASRKSALGLSCYCRNPNNFRPTDVPGYLTVDIVDFDPGSVYSVRQIQKARESFRPKETLSFIHQLATAPMGSDSKNLDVVKNMAIALAYRRSVFEEFDETYAEAFGHKPERLALPQTSVGKEPFRAPLSGPLVFADTRGAKKSYTKATKPKDQSKKDKYLFKRRDESNDSKTTTITQDHDSPSSSAYDDGASNSAAAGYVFQKRDQTAFSNDPSESPGSGLILTSVPQSSIPDEATTADSVDVRTSSDNLTPSGNLLKKKKKTAAKRPASELSSEKLDPQKKKVKKLKKSGKFKSSELLERPSAVLTGPSSINSVKKDGEAIGSIPHQVGSTTLPTDWDTEVSVHQMLSDLLGLALNPSHCMERNGPDIPRHFFLKFRSLYFVKSYSESEQGETQTHRALGPESADKPLPESSSKTVTSLKKPKVSIKPDDPTKVSRKRIPSERQEENAAKKAKKITDVKSLAEKRAQLKKNPGSAQSSDGKQTQSLQSKPVKKPERPQKVEEPTYLVMKFQEGSSLPSLMELKARFTRFGPLDTSLNRVFYKTYTCRVAFLYKQDANVAYRYAVGSKSLFPNVRFMLRPVAGPESQQPITSKTESESGFDPSPFTIDPRPAIIPPPYAQPLKSILKKPGGDESGGPSNGGGNSRTPRVRFNVGDEKSIGGGSRGGGGVKMMESRNSGLSSNEGASLMSSSSSSSSSSIVVDVNKKNQRLLPPLPLQPPLLPLPRFPPRPPINPHFYMYPNNNFHENPTTTTSTASVSGASYVLPPPPPPPAPPSVDISQQLMSLLTRCNDVVTNVKSVLGYVPYHSL